MVSKWIFGGLVKTTKMFFSAHNRNSLFLLLSKQPGHIPKMFVKQTSALKKPETPPRAPMGWYLVYHSSVQNEVNRSTHPKFVRRSSSEVMGEAPKMFAGFLRKSHLEIDDMDDWATLKYRTPALQCCWKCVVRMSPRWAWWHDVSSSGSEKSCPKSRETSNILYESSRILTIDQGCP